MTVSKDSASLPSVKINRPDAMAPLIAAVQRAQDGSGSIVFISGEAGVGKTTLVRSFIDHVGKMFPGVVVLESSCTSISDATSAYHPFRKVIASLLGADVKSVRGNKNVRLVAKIAPTWLTMIPVAGNMLAAIAKTISEINETHLPYEYTAEEISTQFVGVIEKLQKKHLLVLVIEDAQWIDKSSIDLIFNLSKSIDNYRLVVICTSRSSDVEHAPAHIGDYFRELIIETTMHNCAIEIELSPFSATQTRELLSGLFPQNNFSVGFVNALYERSGGNPFFIDQLIKLMIEENEIVFDGRIWNTTRNSLEKTGPVAVGGVIGKTLDRLSDDLLRILNIASVDGYSFLYPAVQMIYVSESGRSLEDFESSFKLLERKHHLVISDVKEGIEGTSDLIVYRFSHGLIQESIYGSLSPGRRQKYHRQMGDELIKFYGLEDGGVLTKVATHYRLAKDYLSAARFYYLSGKWFEKVYATEEAIRNFGEAVSLVENYHIKEMFVLDLYLSLADQLANQEGQFDKAIPLYKRASDMSRELGKIELYIKCIHMQGVCLKNLGRRDEALSTYRSAIELAENSQLHEREGNVIRDVAKIYIEGSEYTRALDLLERSWILLKNTTNYYAQAATKCFMGQALRGAGNLLKARRALNQALGIYEKHGFNSRLLLSIYAELSLLGFQEGNWAEGEQYARESIRIGVDHFYYHQLSEFYLQLGAQYLNWQRIARASDAFGHAAYYGYRCNEYQYKKSIEYIKGMVNQLTASHSISFARHLCEGMVKFSYSNKDENWGKRFRALWLPNVTDVDARKPFLG